MMDYWIIMILLAAILVLDLTVRAARSALGHASWASLIHLHAQDETNSQYSVRILETMPRPYASLYIAQILLRFLFVALLVFLVFDPRMAFWEKVLLALGIGLIVAYLEWIVVRKTTRDAEQWLLRLAGFVWFINLIFYPLAGIGLLFSNEKTGRQQKTKLVTEDIFKMLVDIGEQDGTIEQEESKMIQSIFQLDDTLTREIMVPRIDVQALDIKTPMDEAIDLLLSSGFSRVPVYDETIDRVLGLLYAKDLLKIWQEGKKRANIQQNLLRQPYFVPEAKKIDELLTEMQKRHVHMAIVVDEYGGVAGVVTFEDIIEEIFGEIQDEYDEEEELPYRQLENGDHIFRGRVDLDDFNEIMSSNLPSDEADTLGGFLYARLGHVPVQGEQIREEGLLLTIELVTGHRIRKVRAERIVIGEENKNER